MLGNFNVSKDKFGLAPSQNEPGSEILTLAQIEPITIPPQYFSRRNIQMINNTLRGPEIPLQNGKHFEVLDKSRTSGKSIESSQRNAHHSDQNPKPFSPSSVIINLGNITKPSTSCSVNSHPLCSNILLPEQCRINISETKLKGDSYDRNVSNEGMEGNTSSGPFYSSSSSSSSNSSNNNNSYDNENNEGTQTQNQNLRTYEGNDSIDEVFNKYVNFLIFISAKIIYDHREGKVYLAYWWLIGRGILIFIGLFVTFIHANSVIKREVAKQNRRSLTSLGIIFVNLFVSVCLIYFVFQDQQLYKNLIFIPPSSQPVTMWDLLWIVGITDFVLKFITIQLKVGILYFPEKLLAFSARGNWYCVLESVSQVYRGLVPIQPWLCYLTVVYDGLENSAGMFFFVFYIIAKGLDIMSKLKLFLKAVWKLLSNTSLGTRPSKAELLSSGHHCPICHDEYNAPITLKCRHVFCESCVSVWFDRERTCPLCRAKIADNPSWRDGATSFFVQMF